MTNENKLESIVSWAKRRGFVMPGSEIYNLSKLQRYEVVYGK